MYKRSKPRSWIILDTDGEEIAEKYGLKEASELVCVCACVCAHMHKCKHTHTTALIEKQRNDLWESSSELLRKTQMEC